MALCVVDVHLCEWVCELVCEIEHVSGWRLNQGGAIVDVRWKEKVGSCRCSVVGSSAGHFSQVTSVSSFLVMRIIDFLFIKLNYMDKYPYSTYKYTPVCINWIIVGEKRCNICLPDVLKILNVTLNGNTHVKSRLNLLTNTNTNLQQNLINKIDSNKAEKASNNLVCLAFSFITSGLPCVRDQWSGHLGLFLVCQWPVHLPGSGEGDVWKGNRSAVWDLLHLQPVHDICGLSCDNGQSAGEVWVQESAFWSVLSQFFRITLLYVHLVWSGLSP